MCKTKPVDIVSVPAKVNRVRVTNIGVDYVSLAWEPPKETPTGIDEYEVKYIVTDRDAGNHTYTSRQNITVTSLSHQTEYAFLVSTPHPPLSPQSIPSLNFFPTSFTC